MQNNKRNDKKYILKTIEETYMKNWRGHSNVEHFDDDKKEYSKHDATQDTKIWCITNELDLQNNNLLKLMLREIKEN